MFGRRKIIDVTPEEAAGRHERGAVLLDVREDDERAAGHAPQAGHMPLAQVDEASARFGGRSVLTVCGSGKRSADAAKRLAEAGAEVRNVAGGMSCWAGAGLAVVRDDGSPGVVA